MQRLCPWYVYFHLTKYLYSLLYLRLLHVWQKIFLNGSTQRTCLKSETTFIVCFWFEVVHVLFCLYWRTYSQKERTRKPDKMSPRIIFWFDVHELFCLYWRIYSHKERTRYPDIRLFYGVREQWTLLNLYSAKLIFHSQHSTKLFG